MKNHYGDFSPELWICLPPFTLVFLIKTYKEIACDLDKPKSARAVANACGKNPYVPAIPCHRVIRSDGYLGGYSGDGGIEMKKQLLISEGFLDFKSNDIK